jgi:hypothetical protein
MNRWICRDFYEAELQKAHKEWQKGIMERMIPQYKQYKIEEDDDSFSIQFPRPHGWREHLSRFLPSSHIFRDTVWSFIDPHDTGPELPPRYYYSNGSQKREDGTYGWQ